MKNEVVGPKKWISGSIYDPDTGNYRRPTKEELEEKRHPRFVPSQQPERQEQPTPRVTQYQNLPSPTDKDIEVPEWW